MFPSDHLPQVFIIHAYIYKISKFFPGNQSENLRLFPHSNITHPLSSVWTTCRYRPPHLRTADVHVTDTYIAAVWTYQVGTTTHNLFLFLSSFIAFFFLSFFSHCHSYAFSFFLSFCGNRYEQYATWDLRVFTGILIWRHQHQHGSSAKICGGWSISVLQHTSRGLIIIIQTIQDLRFSNWWLWRGLYSRK